MNVRKIDCMHARHAQRITIYIYISGPSRTTPLMRTSLSHWNVGSITGQLVPDVLIYFLLSSEYCLS